MDHRRPAVVLLLALGLAACGGGGGGVPAALPPLSAAPSATPTAAVSAAPAASAAPVAVPATTPPPTELSDDEDQRLRREAEEFARSWIDQLNAAYDSLDPAELLRMSAPECLSCQAYSTSLKRSKAAGETWVGGKVVPFGVTAAPMTGMSTNVLIDYNAAESYVLLPSGEHSDPQPAEVRETLQLSVKKVGHGWLATELASL